MQKYVLNTTQKSGKLIHIAQFPFVLALDARLSEFFYHMSSQLRENT
jgi:hypothetical protein